MSLLYTQCITLHHSHCGHIVGRRGLQIAQTWVVCSSISGQCSKLYHSLAPQSLWAGEGIADCTNLCRVFLFSKAVYQIAPQALWAQCGQGRGGDCRLRNLRSVFLYQCTVHTVYQIAPQSLWAHCGQEEGIADCPNMDSILFPPFQHTHRPTRTPALHLNTTHWITKFSTHTAPTQYSHPALHFGKGSNATNENKVQCILLHAPCTVYCAQSFQYTHCAESRTLVLQDISSLGHQFPYPQDISSLGHWFPRTLVPQDSSSLGHQFPRTLVPPLEI